VLAGAYTERLDVKGLPVPLAHAAQDSVGGAMAVAARLPAPDLAASAADAYLHGMSLVLLVCAGIAVAGAVLVA
jgi:hypothetical protein